MKTRRLLRFLAGCLALAAMADSCGPVITVTNNSDVAVRAVVSSGEARHVVSPAPGESLSVEAEEGSYGVAVIPNTEWLEWAKAVRDNLSGHLADPKGLSTTQVEEIITQLRDIRFKIQAFEASADAEATCNGKITEDGGGTVSITPGANGGLFVACD